MQKGKGAHRSQRTEFTPTTHPTTLSNTPRTVEQQAQASQHSPEEATLVSARDSNHQAKSQLKKRLLKNSSYTNTSKSKRALVLAAKEEKLAKKRYNDKQSCKLSHNIITAMLLTRPS
jgi:hypothetical protein